MYIKALCFGNSPVAADLFMKKLEKLANYSFDCKPKCWFTYVDDTFVVWPHNRITLNIC